MPSLMIFILFQVVIQSGQSPTILQQMCSLPFHYFSDPRLTTILFPTLIACCYNNQSNREILEQELSCVLLSNFIEVYIYIFQIHTLRPFLLYTWEYSGKSFCKKILQLKFKRSAEMCMTEYYYKFFCETSHRIILIV